MNKYFKKYESTKDLHKELTNIFLLITENSYYSYCYCDKLDEISACGLRSFLKFLFYKECGLCSLCKFLYQKNLMDGLPPEKFLQLNYDNRSKLRMFASKISPFFDRMEREDKSSLDFFDNQYSWSMKDYSYGCTYRSMTLDEIIENDKVFLKNNPQLFDADFLKKINYTA